MEEDRYEIAKDDKNYKQYKRQIRLLNDTSLNLDNVMPLESSIMDDRSRPSGDEEDFDFKAKRLRN